MSNAVPGVAFSLSCTKDFSDWQFARSIVEWIGNAKKSIRPDKYGPFSDEYILGDLDEPVRFLANKDGKVSEAGGLVMKTMERVSYQIQWAKTAPPSFSFVAGYLMNQAFEEDLVVLDDFLDFQKKLAVAIGAAYGDVRNMNHKDWSIPRNLQVRLPDVPSVSIYGEPYVKFFGRQKIETAPFHKIEQLADNIYFLQSTENPTDIVPEDIRSAIRQHFGEDAFMVGKKWRYSDGRHPSFIFE